MNEDFRRKLQEKYQNDSAWSKLLSMLKKLIIRVAKEISSNHHDSTIAEIAIIDSSSKKIDVIHFFAITAKKIVIDVVDRNSITNIDFCLKEGLIYHVKNDKKRLCISQNAKVDVLKTAHDNCFHVDHHRVYARLSDFVYVHKLSRKLIIYIRHCPSCQLNQIRRHRDYDELISIFTSFISFHIIVMNFVLTLLKNNSSKHDCVLNITNKFNRRVLLIASKSTHVVSKWAIVMLDRLQFVDWDISVVIISNRDLKFLFDFWIIMLKKLDVKMLLSSIYHSQIDDQSERINQIFEIALRYLIFENLDMNWKETLSALQMTFNNAMNFSTDKTSNEICYEFKIKEVVSTVDSVFTKNITTKAKNQLSKLKTTRFRYRMKATNASFYASLKFKVRYDSLHVPLLLKSRDKIFLRLHRDYNLSEKHNKKLFNQRCDPFLVKRRVERLVYELNLSSRWQIHSVISVTQLESVLADEDSYKRKRSNYSNEVKVEDILNISWMKFYEVEKLVDRRIRKYDQITIKQYLLRWKDYDLEYNEWKSISALEKFLNLIEEYEFAHLVEISPSKRVRKESTASIPITSSITITISSKKRDRPLKRITFEISLTEAKFFKQTSTLATKASLLSSEE